MDHTEKPKENLRPRSEENDSKLQFRCRCREAGYLRGSARGTRCSSTISGAERHAIFKLRSQLRLMWYWRSNKQEQSTSSVLDTRRDRHVQFPVPTAPPLDCWRGIGSGTASNLTRARQKSMLPVRTSGSTGGCVEQYSKRVRGHPSE